MHYTSGKGFPIWEKSKTDPSAKCNFIRCLFPQGINGKCVKIQILHAYLNLKPLIKPQLNFKKLILGCIDTYRGVQGRIFQRFVHCTRRKQTKRANWSKIAIFRRGQKMPPRAAFAAYIESLFVVKRVKQHTSKSCYKRFAHSYPESTPIKLRIGTFLLPSLRH